MKNPSNNTGWLIWSMILFTFAPLCGQSWQKTYGGTANFGDVEPTPDGGYIATRSGSAVAFKTDAQGTLLWEYHLPPGYQTPEGESVALSPDGNYVVTGSAYVNTPAFQPYMFLTKLSPAGAVIWEQFFAVQGGGPFVLSAIPGGGYYVGGQYSFLLKTDENGAQLWQYTTGSVSMRGLTATSDGGAVFLVNDNTTGSNNLYIAKVDAGGVFQWYMTYTNAGTDLVGRQLTQTADGGFAVTGFIQTPNSNVYDNFVLKTDANGNQQWLKTFLAFNTDVGQGIAQTQDGGYLVTGWVVVQNRVAALAKLDNQGNVVWRQYYGAGEGLAVKELPDGSIIQLVKGQRLIKSDAQGVAYQKFITGNISNDQIGDCVFQNNEPGLAGWSVWATGPFSSVGITDSNGNFAIPVDTGTYVVEAGLPAFVWQPCQPVSSVHVTAASDTFSLGNLMMQSVAFTTTTVSGYVYQDLDGDCVQDPGEPTLAGCALWAATEGSFAHPQYFATTDANGFYSFTLPAGDYYYVRLYSVQGNAVCQPCNNNFFQPLDASPVVHNFGVQCQIPAPQHLTGFVFFDENKNCAHDFGEQGLSNWTMHIVKQGATDTLIVDGKFFPDGHFAVPVDTGMYYLQIFPPNYLFLPCQFVQTATVVSGGAPPVLFPVMPLADCPNMTVDVGTNALVPCFTSTYHVQYCNTGTAGADSVYVEISLPPALTLTQSEIPWSQQSGSTYTFPVGAVPAGDCGTFWFKTLLDCNSPIGLTHCVEAHVYPDSICGPQNPVWDGSSVSLSAECVGDSVVLSISNIGWGNMSQPLGFIVVEDNVLIRDSSFQLPSGASTLITVYPNGATILLQAQQSPGHPGSSMPVVFVEGCGDDSLSIGFVTQYPQNDADDFLAIDCRESTGSFDPNIKEAQPKGITDAHFIRPSTELTYQITFQNLGTDTAHNVVILDTLSQFLDTTSLRPGVSSHPYTWKLLAGNVLRFSFDNIGLPHAAANTAGSIGFVKYRISQTPGNTPGTQIENRAGIYFDFNAPVMTNTVTHRIPAPFMYDYKAGGVCYGEPYFADTVLVKTLRYTFFDSIFTNDITVYPLQSSETDISVAPGTEVCGQPVFQDTTCITVLPDMHGCDSTVTIRVHVLTDAPENPGEGVFLSIGPNPNRGDFTLQGYLPKGSFCRATLFDHLGREVIKLFDNQWMEGGFNHRINAGNLPPGAYLLKFDSDEVHLFLKMLVL